MYKLNPAFIPIVGLGKDDTPDAEFRKRAEAYAKGFPGETADSIIAAVVARGYYIHTKDGK